MQFTIASAYQWPNKDKNEKINNSEKAIKKIVASMKKRFDNKNHKNGETYQVAYKRLRASAGRTMLDSIIKRIETANVIIVDITDPNKNVFIELGIALYINKNKDVSVYIIKEKKAGDDFHKDFPSDLQGFFISTYTVSGSKITFNDNSSLLMSIAGDINQFYINRGLMKIAIDEINEKENN